MRLLLFVASVLSISDAAQEMSVSDLKCAYEGGENEKGFCVHVQNALSKYKDVLKFVDKLEQFGEDFSDARRRLTDAYNDLLRVLVETSPKVVQDLLKKALFAECGALVRAKRGCLTGKDEVEKKAYCALVYSVMGSTIQGIVDAIVDLEADASKKAELQKIQEEFYEKFPVASPNEAHTLGQSILNATKQRS